ncbi:MAG: hypothetical protein MJ110_00890 [Lachnospiraceae bacterium]|nr:hypothetical protein [Lachnospiraceae bacterium]
MAFMDDFTEKMTDFGAFIKEKGDEVAEKVKLSAALSKEKRTLTDTYTEIGRKYAKAHPDDSEGELELLVKSAQDCEQRILELKAQMEE